MLVDTTPIPASPASPASTTPVDMDSPSSRPPLSDYLWEGWKDLELEYRIRKLDVQQGYTETKSKVREAVRSVRRDAREHAGRIRHEARRDVREILHRGRKLTKHLNLSPRRQRNPSDSSSSSSGSNISVPPLPSLMQRSRLHLFPGDEKKRAVMKGLRDFEGLLADPSFRTRLNEKVASELTPAGELSEYYRERPELKTFTLETELPRLSYTVVTHDGRRITEPAAIVAYAEEQEGLLEERDAPEGDPSREAIELLWRAANQSIFGDAISCLTTPEALVRPQLGMASFCNDCSLLLDFRHDRPPRLDAECYINVSVPSDEDDRLQLAGVLLSLSFAPSEGTSTAKILHISPSPPLSQADLESAGDYYIGF